MKFNVNLGQALRYYEDIPNYDFMIRDSEHNPIVKFRYLKIEYVLDFVNGLLKYPRHQVFFVSGADGKGQEGIFNDTCNPCIRWLSSASGG